MKKSSGNGERFQYALIERRLRWMEDYFEEWCSTYTQRDIDPVSEQLQHGREYDKACWMQEAADRAKQLRILVTGDNVRSRYHGRSSRLDQ